MSSGITLTAATRQNLLSLQGTADLLTQTQNRLSTGKKVNSALDDPTSFFTSQALSGRSGDLGSLLNGISNGVQTIQAANQGITSIQKLVDSAKSTANQALADKSATTSGLAATAASVNGSKSFQGLAGTADGTQDFSTLGKDGSLDITIGTGAAAKTATIRLDSSTLTSAGTDLTKVTAGQVVSAINSQIANNADLKGKVSASLGSDGRIGFSTTSAGSTQQLTVAGSKGSTLDIGFGKASSAKVATLTATGANVAAATDFSGGGSAAFTVNDGLKAVSVKIDQNSATDANGGTVGTSGDQTEVLAAINKQLKDGGSTVTASINSGNKLVFSSTDSGPDAQLTVTPSAGGVDLGFGGAFTPVAGTASGSGATAASTGSVTLGANTDLSSGKSATFTVGNGTNSTTFKIDSTSLDASGTALGDNPAKAKLLEAINAKITAGGVTGITASAATGLAFTGTGVTVAASSDTIGLGFGTNAATSAGTPSAGTGTAAIGLSSTGSDATDGSAKAVVNGTAALTAGLDLSTKNANFTIQLGTGPAKTIKIDNTTGTTPATTTKQQIVDSINKQIGADTGLAGNVVASLDVNDKLVLSSTTAGASQKLTIQAAQGATASLNADIGFGLQSSSVAGQGPATAMSGFGKDSTGSTNTVRQTLAKQFNEILNQITQQAKDSSYNGINLLYRSGDDASENSLKVTFNESGSSSLTIAGSKLDADGLGLTASTGGFQTDTEISQTLTAITAATSQLRTQSSTFGSNLSVVQNRQDFSKNLINILDTGSANLTNADLNEEAANSQALSTRQSIGISALSLANTAQQGILQLLR
ncbi:flagellin [Methylobacterium sp. 88A]|uniref:flagellin N-terminal helical domain-containing protein n=1 Tax=Methylobacterium sp. 88A TaxID=1131813 RepID=UPI00036D80B0|nr:flagellin [Methylobacterium sp. 88A]